MRERVALAGRRRLARDVGDDLPLGLRADPADRGRAARLQAQPSRSTTRPTRCGWSSAAWTSSRSTRSATRRARCAPRSRGAKNQLIDAETYARGRGRPAFEESGRRGLRALRAPDARGERDGLRRPAGPRPSTCSSCSPTSASATGARFRWVLVDEYQDTNRAQYRLLQLLAGEHGNLTVVGDDVPVGLRLPRRRHPQHPRLRARLPGRRRWSSSSRTTARPRRSSTPPTR